MTWRLYFFVANPVSGTCGRISQVSPRHSKCRQNLNYMICSTFYKSIYGLPLQHTARLYRPVCLQNHLSGNFRSSGFRGHFGLFRAVFASSGRAKYRVFTSGSPRKGLTAFPELKFPPFSISQFCHEKLPFSCRKGLVASPRGRFRRLAAALLQRRKGPVATP